MRGRFEGLWNVVRFNWPKYAIGVVVLSSTAVASTLTTGPVCNTLRAVSVLAGIALLLPLLASHIIYDRSELYTLPWLRDLPPSWSGTILNINAGFDETSALIRKRLPNCTLEAADFYDPQQHTEASIERARKSYTSYPGTRAISTDQVPFADGSMDLVLAFLSLHEVRDQQERIRVLVELHRVLKPDGRLIITEHLRDLPNLMAFSLGFLHFHSRDTWLQAFGSSGFDVGSTMQTTTFITTYILRPC